jgi:hypothetical protein
VSGLFGEEAWMSLGEAAGSVIKQVQGQEANHSGQYLEEQIIGEFKRRGIHVGPFDNNNTDLLNKQRLLRRVPYRSLYGITSFSEFLYVDDSRNKAIRIECRWQEQPGSVDEKFPYLFLNARDRMPEKIVWLVIGGDGARPAAFAWIKREAKAVTAKSIQIMTPAEAKKAIKQLLQRSA